VCEKFVKLSSRNSTILIERQLSGNFYW